MRFFLVAGDESFTPRTVAHKLLELLARIRDPAALQSDKDYIQSCFGTAGCQTAPGGCPRIDPAVEPIITAEYQDAIQPILSEDDLSNLSSELCARI